MGSHTPAMVHVSGEGKRHLVWWDREDPNPTCGCDPLGVEGSSSLRKQSIPGMFCLYIFVGMGVGEQMGDACGSCLFLTL